MIERILSLLRKEFRQIARDKRMRALALGVPIVQLLVFGYAAVVDVKHISTAICDRDNSATSRELIARLGATDYFDLNYVTTDEATIRNLMDRGAIYAVVEIPSNFEQAVLRGQTGMVRIACDGTNPTAASVITSYASSVVQAYAQDILEERGNLPNKDGILVLEQRALYNPSLDNRYFYVPGIIAMIVLIVGMNLTAMSIVREKEQGTLEQIIVTPIKSFELILGKTLPFVIIVLVAISGQMLVALYWFRIPFRGDWGTLYLGIVLFLILSMGLGIFISTISQTQQQAMLTGFFVMMPAILLSGFMFPVENMPPIVRALTWLNPMRHFLLTLRVIFLKGAGLEVLWPQYAVLGGLGFLIFIMSSLRFQKRLG